MRGVRGRNRGLYGFQHCRLAARSCSMKQNVIQGGPLFFLRWTYFASSTCHQLLNCCFMAIAGRPEHLKVVTGVKVGILTRLEDEAASKFLLLCLVPSCPHGRKSNMLRILKSTPRNGRASRSRLQKVDLHGRTKSTSKQGSAVLCSIITFATKYDVALDILQTTILHSADCYVIGRPDLHLIDVYIST